MYRRADMACQDGRLESVKALLDGGAKVSQRLDKYKVTPLAIAAERGHKAIVEHLLKYGGARGGIEMKDQ
jgi:ankyrin repeat protein